LALPTALANAPTNASGPYLAYTLHSQACFNASVAQLVSVNHGTPLTLQQGRLGRAQGNPLVLADASISSQHAEFEQLGGQWWLTDLGSTNGTWQNGLALVAGSKTLLHHGDLLRFGALDFRFDDPASVTDPVSAAAPVAVTPVAIAPSRTVMRPTALPFALVLPGGREEPVFGSFTIGRDSDSDLVLADDQASGQHLRVEVVGERVEVEDLGSRNGSFLNGQRLLAKQEIKHGDRLLVGNSTLRLRVSGAAFAEVASAAMQTPQQAQAQQQAQSRSNGRQGLVFGVVALLLLGSGIWFAISQSDRAAERARQQAIAAAQQAAQNQLADAAKRHQEAEDRAQRASVFIESGIATGSGSVIKDSGYILTNHHVIAKESGEKYQNVRVGLNLKDPTSKPDTFYLAEVVADDPELDLALLKVTNNDDGTAFNGRFDTLPLGDSDLLRGGDEVVVIGFPAIGEDTLTITRGAVSGFLPDADNNLNRGWIKTDSEINPGNSGGTAINAAGELVGIPTLINRLGGTGKIGYLRPINEAREILKQVQ
jgi:pSer/pThr/pTyr-binding forkhead associated (FHA) protein